MGVAKAYKDKDFGEEKVWSPLELAEMKTGRRLGQIRQAKGFAGRKRMRITDGAACYHVMSRVVNGDFLLGAIEKEALRRMMWRMAMFSGVEILTYAIMDNHFHILLKVPEQQRWLERFDGKGGEEKFFEHLSLVYSKAFIMQLRRELTELRERDEGDEAQALLGRFKRRFCDLSLFVKELKERFSRWYNKQNGRRGTLWMDRFKSVLVENGRALQAMAAYIDLNPVRAGIVEDPAMYAWSGYGEAVGGSKRSRRGLCKVLVVAQDSWNDKAHAYYRKWLYAEGVVVEEEQARHESSPPRRKRKGFATEQMQAAVIDRLALPVLQLRKRIRSFSEGIALGSEDYVKGVAERYRAQFERQRERKVKPLKRDRGRVGSIFVMRRCDD
jgi:REP element-mobilizing transposase RayT